MKIALQLSGYFNNKADPNSGLNGYAYIQKEIFQQVESLGGSVDVFLHSWEPERERFLCNLYKPKAAIFEKQKVFSEVIKNHDLADHEYYDQGFDRQSSMYAPCNLESTLSFLYGRFKCNELREKLSVINYDWIIISRFDLGQRDKFGNWEWRVSQLDFDPRKLKEIDSKKEYVYSAMWDQLNCGMADQWFIASQENARKIAQAYSDCVRKHFKRGSGYERKVTSGWPDSRPYDVFSPVDPNQFTNEILKPESERSKELMKYPLWQCVNNHILYKYLMIDMNLYNQLKFIDKDGNIYG